MRTIRRYALLAALLAFATTSLAADTNSSNQISAFPGAEGAGAFTTGGRGGSVYRVTNLNADGPGSLADAVSQPNRIVVFAVSGIIDLTTQKKGKGGKIIIDQPHITIAGQTAPGEGICLKGGALDVQTSDVIIRHLRSRRGFVRNGDTGDAITAKPPKTGKATEPAGQTEESFEKRMKKKEGRGKAVYTHAGMEHVLFDHLSASWATDENITCTHPNFTTLQYCIASEGLDYANPKQTPPNHSEGSLWGTQAPDGRCTMHHMLYAHNRLRNPRTTGGAMPPPVLQFSNGVVYDWSEYASHTGSEAVHLNWLHSYYEPGPSTPADARRTMFEFHGDPRARLFASGNFFFGFPEATKDNRLAVGFGRKLRGLSDAERAAMIVDKPFDTPPVRLQSAGEAFETVLAEAGATLPARDAVDLRIVNDARNGTGKVIEKETDLPADQRWPDYRSLPTPADSDGDGLPDFWEKQFGLDPNDAKDSAKISAGGYANIEHYFNNTDPTGGSKPVVFIAATVSRALPKRGQVGEWRVTRSGDLKSPLAVSYAASGSAAGGKDYEPLSGTVTIPAGAASATIKLSPAKDAADDAMVVLTLATGQSHYHVGCPSASLVVIRK
ncbi:MAG: hypothetical protein NTY01_06575 [Verrucomicrobia bacterium]|nr:hypothetical protein [Verrucomicrobiota bacterium]